MNLANLNRAYGVLLLKLSSLFRQNVLEFVINFNFLHRYFLINEMFWQEGLLIDFLQKKIIDNWLKKFVIYSGYLLSEKLIFDNLIRFYINSLLLPFQKIFVYEVSNVSNLMFVNIFFFVIIFFIIILIYFFFCFF